LSCFYLRPAWRAKLVNPETGKRSLVFNPRDGFSDMAVDVPCGKCDGCRADRSMAWSIRCYQEASLHARNSFLTLTYDDEHLPEDGKIHKPALQGFFRGLRNAGYVLRYFACGEYGDQTRRPHYHALIFGQDFLSSKNLQLSDDLYSNPDVNEIWGQGRVVCAPVTMAACCYVAGYVDKKVGDVDTFSLMSRRPGIGKECITKYFDDVVRTGSVVVEGKELPVPQRYMAWMEEELKGVKADRLRKVQERKKERGYFELDRELRAKEKVQKQRIKNRQFKGKI